MTAKVEEIVDPIVGGEEALGVPGRLEALHLPLSSARGLVRVLRPVVQTLVLPVLDTRHDLALRSKEWFESAVLGQVAGILDIVDSTLLEDMAGGGP